MSEPIESVVADNALTDVLAHALGAPTAFQMNMAAREHVAYLARLIRQSQPAICEDAVRAEEAIARERAKSRVLARALFDQQREEERHDFGR